MSPGMRLAIVALLTVSAAPSIALSCLDPGAIKETDSRYENAILDGDHEFLNGLLADEFIWVHNDARQTDSKQSLLDSVRGPRSGSAGRSRVSTDVEVRRKGDVAVVSGFTTVKRGSSVQPAKYHFMRTYVLIDGDCLLLANHTMRLPDAK